MRSQANEWAARVSPEMKLDPGAQGVFSLESSSPGDVRASRRETGGVGGSGTLKEDDPVTREAPVRPVGRSGLRRTGDPLRRAHR